MKSIDQKKDEDQIPTSEKKLSKPISSSLDKNQKLNKPQSPKLIESTKSMANVEVTQKSNKKTSNLGTSSSKALPPEKVPESLPSMITII